MVKRYTIGTWVDGELLGKDVVLASDYDAHVARLEQQLREARERANEPS